LQREPYQSELRRSGVCVANLSIDDRSPK
jgi:hypothetical protein